MEQDNLAYLDALLAAAPEGAGFNDLVASAQGADPATILERIQALGMTVDVEPPRAVLDEQRRPLPYSRSLLPLPHPLDFEWRFSATCARTLIERARSVAGPSGRVALLATPSIAERLADSAARNNTAAYTLFEIQRSTCRALEQHTTLSIEQRDVATLAADQRVREQFTLVLADPPWYLPSLHAFVRSGSQMLHVGGTLQLCIPGLATRPGIDREREQLVIEARRVGLATEAVEQGVLEYDSPPFEQSAFQAASLPLVERTWRSGDIIRFRKLSPHADLVPTPSMQIRYEASRWTEFQFGRSRIRVDTARTAPVPALRPAVASVVLPTVSSRDPRRAAANVWTTSNQVYLTPDPHKLAESLRDAMDSFDGAASLDADNEAARIVLEDLRRLTQVGAVEKI